MKLVRGHGYGTYISKETKKDQKEERNAEEEKTAAEAPDLIVIQVNIILHSIFANVEVYINNQQSYNSNGFYAHKSYISNNFKGAISEYKGFLHCQGYDYEKLPDENVEAPLSEPFFSRRKKC